MKIFHPMIAELEERIYHVRRDRVEPHGEILPPEQSDRVLRTFLAEGAFEARERVESDPTLVQALPVVVVRNRRGDFLRLKRREKSREHSLNEEFVIWAGGHVREEDAAALPSSPVLAGVARELEEELRLTVRPEELRLMGAVHSDTGERTGRHIAFVYEWNAEGDDVDIVLNDAEFFERRGASQSGTFVSAEGLGHEIARGAIREPWSVAIASQFFGIGPSGPIAQGSFA